ncbi:MAG: hypothetical protein R2825_07760 [Saprospiraceae bacterium]
MAGLQSGKGLIGEDGILRELMRHLVQSSLEGELRHHLKGKASKGGANRRNGHTSKTHPNPCWADTDPPTHRTERRL